MFWHSLKQLLPGDSDSDIIENFTPFSLHGHDHTSDKFFSLALCIKNNINIMYQEYCPTVNGLRFVVTCDNNIWQQNLSFLLLYLKNSSNIFDFLSGIEYLLRAHTIDIILGDLNINFYNSKDMMPLTSLMESLNYVQIVHKPTFISGSLLHHVYIRQAKKVNV